MKLKNGCHPFSHKSIPSSLLRAEPLLPFPKGRPNYESASGQRSATASLSNKLKLIEAGYQSLIRSTLQKLSDCGTPTLAVIERVVIHIHPDEFVGKGHLHAPGMGHTVIDGSPAVFETISDTLLHDRIDLGALLRCEVLADHITTQGKWQTGLRFEPFPHVGNFLKSLIGLGQLSLMDDESDIDGTGTDRIEDPVEGNNNMVELGPKEELGTQIGTSHEARHGDLF